MASHAPVLVRQSDFSGGEISPMAYGHTDSPAYLHGLRLCRNFFPTPEGQLLNRSGTRFMAAIKDETHAPEIVPFTFSDTQSFVLEFGDKYLRIYQEGVFVVDAPATPWAIADVGRLKFAQNGDVITVVCVNGSVQYAPYEIARVSNLVWTVTAVSYPPKYFGIAPTIKESAAAAVDWSAGHTYVAGDYAVDTDGGAGQALYIAIATVIGGATNLNKRPKDNLGTWWALDVDESHPAKAWRWCITALLPDAEGNLRESMPGFAATPGGTTGSKCAVFTDRPKTVLFNPLGGFTAGLRIYRGEGNVYGLVGTATGATGAFVDKGDAPDFGTQPPAGTNPWLSGPANTYSTATPYGDGDVVFNWANQTIYTSIAANNDGTNVGNVGTWRPISAWDPVSTFAISAYTLRGGIYYLSLKAANTGNDPETSPAWWTPAIQFPGAVSYHEQRIIYARSNAKPQDFWGSAIGDYKRFDINTPQQDSDSFDFKPASDRLEEIRSLLSLRHLLLFTGNGVWHAYGAQGPVTPSSIILRRSFGVNGASYLQPIAVDSAAIMQTDRNRIRDLIWDWRLDSYTGRDIGVISRHLNSDGHSIVRWAYAQTPYSIIWAVRDDGMLLSLTYEQGKTEGWAQHTTGGCFERVCTVPEVDPVSGVVEDATYVVVKRIINGATRRYMERFSTRQIPLMQTVADDGTSSYVKDVRYCNFLDASLEFDGHAAEVSLGTKLFLTTPASNWVAGGSGIVTSSAAVFDATWLYGSIILDPDSASPSELTIHRVVNSRSVEVTIESMPQDAYLPSATDDGPPITDWAKGAQQITGLGHIAGQTVDVLADGAVEGPYVVGLDGTVTLGQPAAVVQVGLPYNSDMELLDIGAEQVKTNVKSVSKVSVEVVDSRGIYAGESFDNLTLNLFSPPQQQVSDGNTVPPLKTDMVDVAIASSWNWRGGRACVRQSDPLPLCIAAVIRTVTIGGQGA